MQDEEMSGKKLASEKEEAVTKKSEESAPLDEKERLDAELQEANDKYLRLYAEFENYKKRVGKDREELLKYGNESLLHELLPVVDHLEMALKHASDDVSSGLIQGVEITLKELKKTLQKFGLKEIETEGKLFDPIVHHAMAQVERNDVEENTVVEEYRKGYMLNDKVLRAPLVAVSKKPGNKDEQEKRRIKINDIEEES